MTELSAQPTAAIRVALIGTGNVGKPALVHLINDARFELTGVWVSSEAKAGKDAAELAGLDGSTGITATNDLDAVLATDPECAVYTALADNRLPEANGWEVAKDYRERFADLPVLYVTGYAEQMQPVPGGIILSKPYRMAQVIGVLGTWAA